MGMESHQWAMIGKIFTDPIEVAIYNNGIGYSLSLPNGNVGTQIRTLTIFAKFIEP